MRHESQKPLEPGCLALVYGLSKRIAYDNGKIVTLSRKCHVPNCDYKGAIWEIDKELTWRQMSPGKPSRYYKLKACQDRFLMRLDDPDIQRELELERHKIKPIKVPADDPEFTRKADIGGLSC